VDLVDGDFAANNKKMAGMLTEYAKLKRQQGDAAGAKDIEDRVQQMSKQRKRG
jgi:hypothetical protein